MVDRRQKANSFSPFISTSQKEMNFHSVLPKAAILIEFNLCRADQGPVSRTSWKAVLCLPCLHNNNNNKLYLYSVYIFNCSRRLHSRSKFQFQKILKLIHQDYQLTKQNWLVCGLGTATIKQVWILKFAFETEKFPGLSRNRPLKSRRSSIRLRILVRLWWSPYCTMAIPSSEWTKMDSALNQNFVLKQFCM